MLTCGNCGKESQGGAYCSSCGAHLGVDAGADSPTVVVAPTPQQPAPTAAPAPSQDVVRVKSRPTGSGKRTGLLVAAVAVAVLLVAGVVGVLYFQRQSAADARQQEAAGQLSETLGTLASAKRTADVRAVADSASQHQQALVGSGSEDANVAATAAAFGEIGKLQDLNPDTLDSWPQHRAAIDGAVKQVASSGTALDSAPALGAVDAMVAEGTRQMDAWRLQTLAEQQRKTEAQNALGAYTPEAQAAIKTYSGIMSAAAKMFTTAENAGSSASLASVSNNLHATLSDRRRARDSFAAAKEPTELAAPDAEVENAMSQVLNGINDLSDGVDRVLATCTGSGCSLSKVPEYAVFRGASTTNTQRYNKAVEAWDAALSSYSAQIDAMQAPAKPDV